MRWTLLFLGAIAGCAASTTTPTDTGPPGDASDACLAQLVTLAESRPVSNPGISFSRCTYRGATVYYTPPQCCDQYSALIDAATCEVMCAPDGGLTGAGDGRCTDFDSASCTLVWSDPRRTAP